MAPRDPLDALRYFYFFSKWFYLATGCVAAWLGGLVGFSLRRPALSGVGAAVGRVIFSSAVGAVVAAIVVVAGFKLFLCVERGDLVLSASFTAALGFSCGAGLLLAATSATPATPATSFWPAAGAVTLASAAGVTAACWVAAARGMIRIYPDRFVVGHRVFRYEHLEGVWWGVGEEDLKKARNKYSKPVLLLTPLSFESRGRDFTLYHYYVFVETRTVVVVVQPLFWRSSCAQNLRNGFLEDWRWDGSTEPPAGWVPKSRP
ncbi:MAG: hypothetical protein Kow0069_33160 [Promethearchaeota archaeon]